jgi:hypothetical protein
MLAVAFSFSTSFACSETSHTAASVVESVVSESGMNVTPLAEANAPEAQVGGVAATASVVGAPPIEASAPPAVALAEAIPAEITKTVTVVVPGQNSEDDDGAAIPASGVAAIEPSITEASSQTAVPESEKADSELSAQNAARIEVAGPAAVVAPVEPPSADLNTPPAVLSVDAVPVEITVTMTIVVPGQTSEDDEGAAILASGIAGIEPSLTEEPSQTAAPEYEATPAEVAEQTGTAEAQIAVAEHASVVAVEPPSAHVNAPPAIVSVEAVPVEITETVTVVVPGQKSQAIDDVEITGAEPEHPTAAPNPKRDAATADLDDVK